VPSTATGATSASATTKTPTATTRPKQLTSRGAGSWPTS
jgi:hypothetical protein